MLPQILGCNESADVLSANAIARDVCQSHKITYRANSVLFLFIFFITYSVFIAAQMPQVNLCHFEDIKISLHLLFLFYLWCEF